MSGDSQLPAAQPWALALALLCRRRPHRRPALLLCSFICVPLQLCAESTPTRPPGHLAWKARPGTAPRLSPARNADEAAEGESRVGECLLTHLESCAHRPVGRRPAGTPEWPRVEAGVAIRRQQDSVAAGLELECRSNRPVSGRPGPLNTDQANLASLDPPPQHRRVTRAAHAVRRTCAAPGRSVADPRNLPPWLLAVSWTD